MAQATANAAIEAGLHAAITNEARDNGISFSDQVRLYRNAKLSLDKMKEIKERKNIREGEHK